MSFVSVKCPKCGQVNEVDEVLERYFCLKCGARCDLGFRHIYEADRNAQQAPATTTDEEAEKRLKRAYLFLEDEDWTHAWSYCESVLDYDPENAEAYLIELLVSLRLHSLDELKCCKTDFRNMPPFRKALRFADEDLRLQLVESQNEYERNLVKAGDEARIRQHNDRQLAKYQQAKSYMESARKPDWQDSTKRYLLRTAIDWFDSLGTFADSEELAATCRQLEESLR